MKLHAWFYYSNGRASPGTAGGAAGAISPPQFRQVFRSIPEIWAALVEVFRPLQTGRARERRCAVTSQKRDQKSMAIFRRHVAAFRRSRVPSPAGCGLLRRAHGQFLCVCMPAR